MPTTRAARARAALRITDLPADVLACVLCRMPTVFQIGPTASVSCAFRDAVQLAFKARPYSGEVVTLAGHINVVKKVAAAPDGRIITGSFDSTIKVWRDGACERTTQAHNGHWIWAVVMLPGGAGLHD